MHSESLPELLHQVMLPAPAACQLLGVSLRTWRRWQRGQSTPPRPALALLSVLAGRMPWPGWERFRVQDGALYAPGSGQGVTPAQVCGLPYIIGELETRRRQQAAPAQYLLEFPG